MQEVVTLSLTPSDAAEEKVYKQIISGKLGIDQARITFLRILRKSIDARHRDININLSVQVFIDENPEIPQKKETAYPNVENKDPVIIVGAGPAGLFAALKLIRLGFKPLLFERGKEVSERKKDVALISQKHILNPESNYCFGEGGAGTFSDGKLYTRSNKRGNIQEIFNTFHDHGAPDEILYEAHPHIGTDKLPEVIKQIRQTIVKSGGEIHFSTKVDDLVIESGVIIGIKTHLGDMVKSKSVILATGHSARDVYRMLYTNNVALESKNFAAGIRVEHPQGLIDEIQYHGTMRGKYLPAASYSFAENIMGRGVFSFCMCPGGFIVPSATASNQVVVNGMSPSKRNSPYANSGIVAEVRSEDLSGFREHGVLAGLVFQEFIENMAWQNGGRTQTAPAQRLSDFVKGRMSSSLPEVSYFPGVVSSPVHHWLPEFIAAPLREGFKKLDQKMRGFLTNEAVVVGVESRTSSPVRIPRNKDTYQHISITGLFPCGEGSGYAGGITSSAMDGQNAAEKVVEYLTLSK
jgi:uncharacterized protein